MINSEIKNSDQAKRDKAIEFGQKFIDFLKVGTTQYQVVETFEALLKDAGFECLEMDAIWKIGSMGKYYIKPYDTAIFAFTVGKEMHQLDQFRIIGSHIDSPGFKIKPKPEISKHQYMQLNIERYGSPIYYSWLDRRLSIGGKIMLRSDDAFLPKKVITDFSDISLAIPSLALHRNRDVNKGVELKVQTDMIPMFGQLGLVNDGEIDQDYFTTFLANQLDVSGDTILDYDLNLYVNEPGQFIGINNEMIKAPRIDNLAMAYTSMMAIIKSQREKGVNMVACFDNEEVGSHSKQGADASMLNTIMERIFHAYDKTKEQYMRVLPKSYFISADGAYAIHPNHTDKNDPTNICLMNSGITIKINANRSYATDTETTAIFQQLCDEIDIPYQKYVNHSDMPGGKSIGSMIESQIGVKGVDVGAPMLAMHSAMEYVGTDDLMDSYELFAHYFRK